MSLGAPPRRRRRGNLCAGCQAVWSSDGKFLMWRSTGALPRPPGKDARDSRAGRQIAPGSSRFWNRLGCRRIRAPRHPVIEHGLCRPGPTLRHTFSPRPTCSAIFFGYLCIDGDERAQGGRLRNDLRCGGGHPVAVPVTEDAMKCLLPALAAVLLLPACSGMPSSPQSPTTPTSTTTTTPTPQNVANWVGDATVVSLTGVGCGSMPYRRKERRPVANYPDGVRAMDEDMTTGRRMTFPTQDISGRNTVHGHLRQKGASRCGWLSIPRRRTIGQLLRGWSSIRRGRNERVGRGRATMRLQRHWTGSRL